MPAPAGVYVIRQVLDDGESVVASFVQFGFLQH